MSENELRGKEQELAIVNEKLQEKGDELEAAEKRFRVLTENVPTLFSYIDTDERFAFASGSHEKLFQKSSKEVIGKTVREVLGDDTYRLAQPHIAEVISGHKVSFDTTMTSDGTSRSIRVKLVPDFDESERVNGFFILVTEYTREMDALRSLEESRERHASVLDTVAEAIVTIDKSGAIDGFNRAAERMFGYTAAEAKGRNVNILMPEPYHSEHDSYIERYLRTGEARIIGTGREATGQRKDGSTFAIELAVSEIEHQERFTGIIRDITERKRVEENLQLSREELRGLSARLLTAEEAERRRISRELHDDINQRLALLSIDLETLSRSERAVVVAAELEELRGRVLTLSEDVHAIAYGLHPAILDDLGLSAAVKALINDFSERHGVEVTFRERHFPRQIPIEFASCFYRVIQESLTNIARHSESPSVAIRLAGTERGLRLVIRDFGVGFDVQAARNHRRSLGLVSMEERVRLVGGELVIWSFPRLGTRIRATVVRNDEAKNISRSN